MLDIAAELQKFKAENADDSDQPLSDEQTPDPVETPAEPAETPKEKIRVSSLDDIILDDPRLPESLRGKPASALFDDRTEAHRKANDSGYQKNVMAAERDAAIALFERQLIALKEAQHPAPPPPPPPTSADRLRTRGIPDSGIIADPQNSLARVVEAGADEAEDRMRPRIETLQEQVETLKSEREQDKVNARNASYVAAFQQARPTEIAPDVWSRFAPYASTYIVNGKLNPADPRSYHAALEDFRQTNAVFGGTPQPSPATVPTAPAPPVGAGKAAPPAQEKKPTAHLNNQGRQVVAKVMGVYQKLGLTRDADSIIDELRKDPKTRGLFP